VLSVGATHAFGGLLPTLAAARKHLAPGGRVLIGEGFWDRAPSQEAMEMLGDFTDLATTVDRVVADGWTPVDGHISTRRELDDYEWACWGVAGLMGPGPPCRSGQLARAHDSDHPSLRMAARLPGHLGLRLSGPAPDVRPPVNQPWRFRARPGRSHRCDAARGTRSGSRRTRGARRTVEGAVPAIRLLLRAAAAGGGR
jgi:hypothetical protein